MRYGCTKAFASKPTAPCPARGILGRQCLASGTRPLAFVDTRLRGSRLARTNRPQGLSTPQTSCRRPAPLGCCCPIAPAGHAQDTSCGWPDGRGTLWICPLTGSRQCLHRVPVWAGSADLAGQTSIDGPIRTSFRSPFCDRRNWSRDAAIRSTFR